MASSRHSHSPSMLVAPRHYLGLDTRCLAHKRKQLCSDFLRLHVCKLNVRVYAVDPFLYVSLIKWRLMSTRYVLNGIWRY
ncbi:hypothetical protein Plhal304r1_c001g0001561 [Plasmopara halstedii]